MCREAPRIYLSCEESRELQRLVQAHSTPQALVFRARIVLRSAQPDRPTNDSVADELCCDADTVSKWRGRFRDQRLAGLSDSPRSGRPRAFSPCGPT